MATQDASDDATARPGDGLPDDVSATHGGTDDLDERLVAALERAGHLTRTMVARQAYAEGVSVLQLTLLTRLRTTSSGPRVSDLALELDVSQPTISEALATLRRKGLVARTPDPADRRNSVFSLTDEGRDLGERLLTWSHPVAASLSRVDRADKATALRVVLDVIADQHAAGVVNVARTCLTCHWFDDSPSEPGTQGRYRCGLLDTRFDDEQLRVDCTDHRPVARDRG